MPAYSKTTWIDGSAPAIDATNLNKIEQGIFDSLRQDGSTTMSGQLVTTAGTVTTPAIAPTGDSNTGIFFPAADTIAFGEGGLEAMRINSSGNVGIGTQSPSTKLDASGSIKATLTSESTSLGNINSGLIVQRSANDSQAFFDYRSTPDAWVIGATYSSTGTYKPIAFATSDNERMRITSAGNVGIGTTSPSKQLHVKSGTAEILRLETTVARGSGSNFIQFNDATGSKGFVGYGNTNDVFYLSNDLNESLTLRTNATERVFITGAGNVGIGTTSPSNKLQVVSSTASTIGITTTTAGSEATPATINLSFYGYNNEERGRIRVLDQSANNYNTKMIFYTSSDPTNTMTERMQLSSSGYLLIGYTSSNGAYPLQVNGQIFATSSTIATSDGKYKKDIVALDGALDIVKALNPVQFSWKEHPVHKFNTDVPTVGFIAQEVEQALADKSYLTSIIKKSECTWETETGETIEREVTRDVEKQVTREVEREVTETIDGEEVTRTVTEEITETIIEQVTEIVTEPVKETHTEEFLGIAESNLIAILTKAVKELTAKVEALEAQLNK